MAWELKFAPGELERHYKTAAAFADKPNHAVFTHILKDEPRVGEQHKFYLTAYKLLARDRPPAGLGGAGRIPWSSIKRMADHYNMTFDQTETFIDIIVSMDDEVLNSSEGNDSKQDNVKALRK